MKIVNIQVNNNAGNVKTLISLIDILTGIRPDVCIDFISVKKKKKETGTIKISAIDDNQVMLTYIVLDSTAFNCFELSETKHNVGLNVEELCKFLRTVDKDGTLNISIDSEDEQYMTWCINSQDNIIRSSTCKLRLLQMSEQKNKTINANYSIAVQINCHSFHKTCKDLLPFSQFIEITCDQSQFLIECRGELSSHIRAFNPDEEKGIRIKVNENNPDAHRMIKLSFDLKYINILFKCASLCEDMIIYLSPSSVMLLKYTIGSLGTMIVGISPVGKSNSDEYDASNDQYYDDEPINYL